MSHTTEQPVLEPSNPQGLRIGDICSYSFGEKNRSYSIVEIVRILDNPYEVAEVKFLDVVVDDSRKTKFWRSITSMPRLSARKSAGRHGGILILSRLLPRSRPTTMN